MKDNLKLLVGGIGAFFLYKFIQKESSAKTAAERLVTGDGPITNGSTPGTKSPSASKAKSENKFFNRWIFVDNPAGETIYQGVKEYKDPFGRFGKNPIIKLPYRVEIGVATGETLNEMIQIRTTINNQPFLFWVNSKNIRIMDDDQRERYVMIDLIGRRKTTQELDKIFEFFRISK